MRAAFIKEELKSGLRRNVTMTIALVVSVAVSLTLLSTALLMRSQVNRMKGYWYDKIEVSIFLCGNNSLAYSCTGAVTDEQRNKIKKKLKSLDPTVQEIFYESTQDAYDRFKDQFKGSAIISSIGPDALPESFRVKLDDPANFEVVATAVQGMQGVESIQDQRKLLDRFFQILTGLQSFALAIASAMLLVTVLLVVNTVRVAAFARRRETSIMRSVGASNMAIRLPFILEAAVSAAVGALLASSTLLMIKQFLIDARLAPRWNVIAWVTWSDVLWIVPWIFLVGLVTAVAASSVSLSRYLKS